MDYSVVIPVYNESENLRPLYSRIRQTLDPLSEDYEIIFIDDGSTDSSYEILKGIALSDNYVCVISFNRNYGQHPATITGLEQAKGHFVVTLDSDLQNPPEEIPKLLERMKDGYDMVAGCRRQRVDSLLRRHSSYLINLFFSLLTGVYLKDYGSMLRVFKLKVAKELAKRYREEKLYFPVLAAKITKNIAEVDVNHAERFKGQSRYNFTKLLRITWIIILRFYPKFYGFLQRLHFVKKDDVLYRISKRIVDSCEVVAK